MLDVLVKEVEVGSHTGGMTIIPHNRPANQNTTCSAQTGVRSMPRTATPPHQLTRKGVSVGGVADGSPGEGGCLLQRHPLSVALVQHAVRIRASRPFLSSDAPNGISTRGTYAEKKKNILGCGNNIKNLSTKHDQSRVCGLGFDHKGQPPPNETHTRTTKNHTLRVQHTHVFQHTHVYNTRT